MRNAGLCVRTEITHDRKAVCTLEHLKLAQIVKLSLA